MTRTRVLVVDDSAVMRALLTRVINAQPDMEVVAAAADPVLAIERIRLHSPDVMTLDVEMPKMDGLEFLRMVMRVRPMPVVMVSSLTRAGADATLRALELGAVDFVAKPGADGEAVDAYAEEVAAKVRAAAMAHVHRRTALPREAGPAAAGAPASPAPAPRAGRLIAIGASTGGVEALRELLGHLPEAMPPILIAQHMPAGFTASFANRLNAICRIRVKEGEDGEPLRSGHAYIAPGGHHLVVSRERSGMFLHVTNDPPVNRHRPSVDTLFRSAARAAGARCIGVLLTGMGADGANAMLELRDAGAHNLAQDEASCVIFGMPRQAILAGAVHEVLPLSRMADRLVSLAGS